MSQYFDKKELFLEPTVNQYGSHMVMTNVQKETKRKYWNIDTRFRDDYTEYTKNSPSSYTITLAQRINEVKSIMVCNAEIPMSYYNISTSFENNVLKITRNSSGAIYVLVVKDGNYTKTSLVTEITSKLATLGLSAELTFDISNNFSVFKTINTNTYTISLAVKPTTTCAGVTNSTSAEFDKFNFKTKLGWILGYRTPEYVISNTNQSAISENFVDLNGPRYLYLVADEFSHGNQNSFVSPLSTSILNKNILAKIVMNNQVYGYGTILPANIFNGYLLTDRRSYTGKIDIQRLKIQLVNENGLPVNLNGMDFSFCLEMEYE